MEVGCGTGFVMSLLKEVIPEENLYGCDISSKMIEKAKAKLPKIKFFVSPIEQLNVKDKFDLILFSGTFHHIVNRELLFQKLNEISYSGTLCIIAEPNGEWIFRKYPFLRFFIPTFLFYRLKNQKEVLKLRNLGKKLGDAPGHSEVKISEILRLSNNFGWKVKKLYTTDLLTSLHEGVILKGDNYIFWYNLLKCFDVFFEIPLFEEFLRNYDQFCFKLPFGN